MPPAQDTSESRDPKPTIHPSISVPVYLSVSHPPVCVSLSVCVTKTGKPEAPTESIKSHCIIPRIPRIGAKVLLASNANTKSEHELYFVDVPSRV